MFIIIIQIFYFKPQPYSNHMSFILFHSCFNQDTNCRVESLESGANLSSLSRFVQPPYVPEMIVEHRLLTLKVIHPLVLQKHFHIGHMMES